jgi:HAD superfamily phosphoserine phosphatase-like hydrolase
MAVSAIVYVDFDGTVTRTNMVHYLVYIRFMLWRETGSAAHLLGCPSVVADARALLLMRPRERDRRFYRRYRGIPLAAVEALSERFWRGRGRRYENPAVLERLRAFRARGVPIVIVSGSLEPIIAAWNRVHRLADDVLATALAIDPARVLTGEIDGRAVVEEETLEAIRRYERERGLEVASRTVLSDSHEDLPMLGYATEAIVVRPGRLLRRHAAANGWSVIE